MGIIPVFCVLFGFGEAESVSRTSVRWVQIISKEKEDYGLMRNRSRFGLWPKNVSDCHFRWR